MYELPVYSKNKGKDIPIARAHRTRTHTHTHDDLIKEMGGDTLWTKFVLFISK